MLLDICAAIRPYHLHSTDDTIPCHTMPHTAPHHIHTHRESTLRNNDYRLNSGLQNRNAEKSKYTLDFIYGPASFAKILSFSLWHAEKAIERGSVALGDIDIVYDEADIEISIFIWQFTHVSSSHTHKVGCFNQWTQRPRELIVNFPRTENIESNFNDFKIFNSS